MMHRSLDASPQSGCGMWRIIARRRCFLAVALAGVVTAAAFGAEVVPEPEPVPPPAAALTLDQAIERCLCHDPKLRAGMESVNQARADTLTASLPPNPSVNVSGNLLPLSRPYTVEEPGGPPEVDVALSYSVDWFVFGKRAAAVAAATQGICVSEAEYADLVRQRVTETALAFFDVLEAQALLELARQDQENLERVEVVTRKAVDNGGRPKVELNRVRLEMVGRRRTSRDAQTALITAKARLRALLGCDPGAGDFDVEGKLDAPLASEPVPFDEAYGMAMENRPDIVALRRKVGRARADVVVERRNALPELTPEFVLARQYQESIGSPDVSAWGIGLDVTVPLFNRNQGNRSKAVSVVCQTNYELQTGLLELRSEIEQVVATLQTARQNATSVAEEELALAAQVRDAIGKAYEAGGRPLIDVLDAQRNFRETYRIYISSRAEYWRAVHRYNSAVGKQVVR
jgi:cobalt-zinc-cadmium efflux system outer membrane protein